MRTERGKYWVEELSGRTSSSCGGPEVGTRWWNARRGEWFVKKDQRSAKAKSGRALRSMVRSLAFVLNRAAKHGSASGRRVM